MQHIDYRSVSIVRQCLKIYCLDQKIYSTSYRLCILYSFTATRLWCSTKVLEIVKLRKKFFWLFLDTFTFDEMFWDINSNGIVQLQICSTSKQQIWNTSKNEIYLLCELVNLTIFVISAANGNCNRPIRVNLYLKLFYWHFEVFPLAFRVV